MSLIDHYKVITVTHHNLDISDIGNFYVHLENGQELTNRLDLIGESFELHELLYLETCNRVCFVIFSESTIDTHFLTQFFQNINPGLPQDTLQNIESFVDVYEGESAIKHVFELVSSMDSLVVGEREIFRQFRKAYDECRQNALCGDYMRILEKLAVLTAKKVYSETRIAERALSVVSLAIQAMRERNSDNGQRVLLVGSGETNTLVGKFLSKYGMNNISIFNRSIDNAKKLAEMLHAPSHHLNELEHVEGQFDTIIICTSANRVVIDEQLYRKMLRNDQSEKLIIDLAVPRNISDAVVNKYNVDYIDIGSLKEVSEENLKQRRQELRKARPIIKQQLTEFKSVFHQRQIEKAMKTVPEEIKAIKEKAISEVYFSRIQSLDDRSRSLLTEMMDYMEKKCISVPLKAARQAKS